MTHKAPLSMGFPRQAYRSGFPFPSPGDLHDQGIEVSCIGRHWQVDSLSLNHQGSPIKCITMLKICISGKLLYDTGSSAWHSVMTWRGGMGGGGKETQANTHMCVCVCLWLIHTVGQKPTQHCKAIILKKKKKKKLTKNYSP